MSEAFLFASRARQRVLRKGFLVAGFERGRGQGQGTERKYSTNNNGKMASDEDYASFLERANQDPGEGVSEAKGKMQFRATQEGVKVPKCIVDVVGGEGMWYTSDADERFEGVALGVEGRGLPTEGLFALFYRILLCRFAQVGEQGWVRS